MSIANDRLEGAGSRKDPVTAPPVPMSREAASRLLGEWIDAHSDYLLRYCKQRIRAHDVAEDLVQETFLAAVQSIDSFQGRSAPRTWLIGILRHKIFDKLRTKGRETPIEAEELENKQLDHFFDVKGHWRATSGPQPWSASPEQVFSNRQFLGVLDGCLDKLPEKFRAAFVLRELEELSREEIAERLVLTSNHVGVLLHRARLELQACLQLNWLKKAPTA